MRSNIHTPNENQGESNQHLDQLQKVFQSLYEGPKTMKECDNATGIMRENICWYCRMLRQSNKLFIVGKKYCSITKHIANIYTTNEQFATKNNQLELFANG